MDITPENEELNRLVASAARLGIELDAEEAGAWLAAMAHSGEAADVSIDERAGVFGHRVAMLDFSPQELQRFRQIAQIVEVKDRPGAVETALALSGSSAQSKIQTYPGDADFFERVNIIAPTRQQATAILSEVMRDLALGRERGPAYQLIEVKFGSYPFDVIKGSAVLRAGSPIAWSPEEIRNGYQEVLRSDGLPAVVGWEDVAGEPGWCKLDWVVADPQRSGLSNASNMLDVTWEAPDGSITPLDGYLDPYFQEVYLEAESIPIFSKLAQHVSADALETYVGQLEKEVRKYIAHQPANYGKAAKRMYNIFRLTGRYEEAAFLRELFDEPAAMLYQVWSLIRTIDDCCQPNSSIAIETVLEQADALILAVIRALEGDQEAEIVRLLLRLRDALSRHTPRQELSRDAESARAEVINVVNNFFHDKLVALPGIKSYIDGLQVA